VKTPALTGLQERLLQALHQRVASNPSGQVTLPAGVVQAAELKRVLEALDKVTSYDPVS